MAIRTSNAEKNNDAFSHHRLSSPRFIKLLLKNSSGGFRDFFFKYGDYSNKSDFLILGKLFLYCLTIEL